MSQLPLARVSLIDALVGRLETAIKDGTYPPDTQLPGEAALSESFEVSRPVVREALARLRERGYVETINGRGTFVRSPDVEDVARAMLRHLERNGGSPPSVNDLYEVRRIIELEAVVRAAKNADDQDFASLDHHLSAMVASTPDDPRSYTAADVGFHLAIAEATHNPLFAPLLAPLIDPIVRSMFTSVTHEIEGMSRGTEEHGEILERLRARDADGAREALALHLERSQLAVPGR